VLCFEMLTGFVAFSGDDEEEIARNILMKNIDDNYDKIKNDSAKSFFDGLFLEKPTERLGMEHSSLGNIRDHSFFGKKFKWSQIEQANEFESFSSVKLEACPLPKQVLDLNEINKLLPSIDGKLLKTIDQTLFEGFDYVDINSVF
jgi:hypothetical protein